MPKQKALPAANTAITRSTPQREVIEIHTTRERKRNASAGGGSTGMRTSKLLLAGSAVAGGGAAVIVADKMHLSPVWAGVATGGAALAGSALFKNATAKDCFFAAGLGGMGVAGVQMLGNMWARRQQQGAQSAPAKGKRQADAVDAFAMPQSNTGFVTRQELNDALGHLADKNADQHKQTCDLMTAMHEEIKKVVSGDERDQPAHVQVTNPVRSPNTPGGVPHLYPLYQTQRAASGDDERNASVDDEYMRNAYGVDDERNAYVDDERNWVDNEVRNYVDDERNAYADDERNAYVEDERNAYVDDERNAEVEGT